MFFYKISMDSVNHTFVRAGYQELGTLLCVFAIDKLVLSCYVAILTDNFKT